jgi:hypothetical protein
MNIQETIALIEALRAAGVTRFKSQEHDIVLDGEPKPIQIPKVDPINPSPVESPAESDAKQKIKDMIKTLNMNPDEMARAMFPEVP